MSEHNVDTAGFWVTMLAKLPPDTVIEFVARPIGISFAGTPALQKLGLTAAGLTPGADRFQVYLEVLPDAVRAFHNHYENMT